MNSLDRKILEALRTIDSGDLKWSAHSVHVRFYITGDMYFYDMPRLSEALYEREGWERSTDGRVSLTDKGRRLLNELQAEAARA